MRVDGDNVLDMLQWARHLRAEHLEATCLTYVSEHPKDVRESEAFRALCRNDAALGEALAAAMLAAARRPRKKGIKPKRRRVPGGGD